MIPVAAGARIWIFRIIVRRQLKSRPNLTILTLLAPAARKKGGSVLRRLWRRSTVFQIEQTHAVT
jgi:hypothetical protein